MRSIPPSEEPDGVRGVVDQLSSKADGDRVPLLTLVEACGTASFVPALMVPALLVVSPLSGIPLFSSLCGITILLISSQMLLRRRHLHLPGFVTRRQLPGARLRGALRRLRPVADFLDRHSHAHRLGLLVGRGGRVVPQLLCVLAGAMMPLLEIVPFSSSILGGAVLCFSVGMLTRDGIFVVAGMAILATAGAVPYMILTP